MGRKQKLPPQDNFEQHANPHMQLQSTMCDSKQPKKGEENREMSSPTNSTPEMCPAEVSNSSRALFPQTVQSRLEIVIARVASGAAHGLCDLMLRYGRCLQPGWSLAKLDGVTLALT